jgi:hypothetical protein
MGVEVGGKGSHTGPVAEERDSRRHNRLTSLGWHLLYFCVGRRRKPSRLRSSGRLLGAHSATPRQYPVRSTRSRMTPGPRFCADFSFMDDG